jgi:hypothetical protein
MTFFQFETDFVQSLRCIPMQVRYKLDTCGLKLKLEHWHRFTQAERSQLVTLPCDTNSEIAAYRDTLQNLIARYFETPAKDLAIAPHPPWTQTDTVPEEVQAQAAKFETSLAVEQWAALSPLQRFALCKLSRPGHENRNFLPALYEFQLKQRA